MQRQLDILYDEQNYKAVLELIPFCDEGDVMTGAYIKKHSSYDVSPNQPMDTFFKATTEAVTVGAVEGKE